VEYGFTVLYTVWVWDPGAGKFVLNFGMVGLGFVCCTISGGTCYCNYEMMHASAYFVQLIFFRSQCVRHSKFFHDLIVSRSMSSMDLAIGTAALCYNYVTKLAPTP
jgi:hypothetical protein